MITQQDLQNLVEAASLAGHNVDVADLELLTWNAGIATHIPQRLPLGFCAVYIFRFQDIYLKVGKAGANSQARYLSHHYGIGRARSSLAQSLSNTQKYVNLFGNLTYSEWICTNTYRYNILIPQRLGKKFLNFAEAFFILKCNPLFEG